MREIRGLQWARFQPKGPFGKPRGQKGAKAKGLQFERALAKALPQAIHGQWIEFADANGIGWAQPDLILQIEGQIVILEAKYTWTLEGHAQLRGLYQPLVECALQRPTLGVEVCKVLTPEAPKAVGDLGEALRVARGGTLAVLHWLGAGQIWAPSKAA